MAGQKIQIKRSITNATVPDLLAGELAFTQAGNNFFIGSPDQGSIKNFRIGHVLRDGILTANQALVANSTQGIDKVITANAVIDKIYANGQFGNTTNLLLYANSTGGIYWGPTSFDASKQYTFTNTITFTGDDVSFSNTVTFTKTIHGTANNALFLEGYSLANVKDYANAAAADAYSNGVTYTNAKIANSTANNVLYVGSVTAVNVVSNAQLSANLANYTNTAGLATLVASYTAGDASKLGAVAADNFKANTSGGLVQNSTGTFVRANNGLIANGSGLFVRPGDTNSGLIANTSGLFVDTAFLSTQTSDASTLGGQTLSQITATAQADAETAYTNAIARALEYSSNAYTWAVANTISQMQSRNNTFGGNTTINGTNTVITSNVAITGGIMDTLAPTANISYDLGSLTNRWKNIYVSGGANNGGLYVGNSTLTSDSSNNLVTNGFLANVITANTAAVNTFTTKSTFNANVAFLGSNVDMINSTLTVDAVKTTSLSIAGDLYVTGQVTTIDSTTLVVNSAFIQVGGNNSISDVLDLGFYGEYAAAGSNSFAGFYRPAGSTDTNPIFRIFSTKTRPTGTVGGTVYQGTIQAYLNPYGTGAGGFIANSTAVNITANASISSTIAANSLTLTTALGVASGGTGFATYSVGDLLYASGGSALSKLAAGTAGQVLQIIDNLPQWATLDAGTF